jgi:hypothetical protein
MLAGQPSLFLTGRYSCATHFLTTGVGLEARPLTARAIEPSSGPNIIKTHLESEASLAIDEQFEMLSEE